ncbi:MAG TPA: choice-of-anchor Q domain-containing protein [Pyrinomonadaceae bacterium]|jgi:CSLREA domain-containing protein|nr:choice-of-anchor Q domain-containing protein [Pyrinomonadaceae bacterium]
MKKRIAWSLLTSVVLVCALLNFTQSAASSSVNQKLGVPRAANASFNLLLLPPTTFTVTKTADTNDGTCDADCSLREAIVASNADVSANPATIDLQAASNYNLTLTNATQENAAATGDLDIDATDHTVTINGAGSTVSGAGLSVGSSHDRVFHVVSGTNTVTFANMIIADGQATDDGTSGASTNPASQNSDRFGGGILNNGGSVALINVTVQSCQALGKGDSVVNNHTTLDAWGGGLASRGTGNVIINGSTFTADAAIGGNGGNFNNGAGSSARGGSIYFEAGTLNIDGSRIDNSNATGGLGGNGPGNQQNGGAGGIANGGGVYVASGTATVNNSTLESCSATGGNSGTGQNGTNPGADSGGGGLYSTGSVTVTNSTFNLNRSTGGDAGDAFGPDCFGAHQAGGGGAARGGAILADGGSLIINTATFANNSANGGNGGDGGPTNVGTCAQSEHGVGGLAHGGAITNNNSATLNIKHGTISGNSAQAGNTGVNQAGANRPPRLVAEGTGGGIRIGPGSVTLENTIIAGNTAANGLGDTTGAPTPGPNVDGAVTSNGHNLLGTATEATGFTGAGDQTGANPMLAALANNGGPTKTMKLLAGSPAIDAGVAAGSTLDQRGMPRPVDDPGVANTGGSDGTDIGAYEAEPSCILTCPTNITVSNDAGQCGAVVNYTTPSGAACGTVTCDHPSGSFFGAGTTPVTCTSSAGPSCNFNVTVNDTENPTITCPADFTVNAPSGSCSAAVNFTVTGSDNCGIPTIVTSKASGSVFSLGTTIVNATATDAAGNSVSCSFKVTVKDVTGPVITTNGQTIELWPPNHKYQTVKITDLVSSASDLCDPSVSINSVRIAKVTSDEPNNSGGDGNTTNDIVIAADCKSVQVRSERMGGGNGRVYTITFQVKDASGNVSTATAKVTVPHSQNGSPAVDSGPQYTVFGGCP